MKLVKLIMMYIILYHIEILFVVCDIPNNTQVQIL